MLFSNTICLAYDAGEFSVSGYAHHLVNSDHIFCTIPDCFLCLGAEESITMHTDCFQLCCQAFNNAERKENFRRLWLAATWRYAWRGMAPLKLPSYNALTDPFPSAISRICGFTKEFPLEISTLIQKFSQSSILWRFNSTLRLVEELNFAKADEEPITCLLSEVLCWSRGSSPKLSQNTPSSSFVCIIIDSRGIKSISRISEDSANNVAQISIHPNVLILEPVETLNSIRVEFKVCSFYIYV